MSKLKSAFSSLRVRLTLWYVLVLAVILVIFSVVFYNVVRLNQYHIIETGLLASAEIIASKVEISVGILRIQPIQPSELPLQDEVFFQIINVQGLIQVRSENLSEFTLPISTAALQAAFREQIYMEYIELPNGAHVRLLTQSSRLLLGSSINSIIQVAVSLEGVERNLGMLRFWLWMIVPAALIVTSVGGIFLADRLLQPLGQMNKSAREIGSLNLNRRLPVHTPHDELGRLATTLNELFDRLEKSFKNQQRFIADASHELRTPLAALRAETEVALRRARAPEEYVALLCSNLDEVQRLSRMAERLLFLTQSDAGQLPLHPEKVQLDELCRRVVDKLGSLARERGIQLNASCAAPVAVSGDEELLEQLLVVLVENALKYTPPGGQVELSCGQEQRQAWLRVQDTGPGIAQEHLPHLFERFYRVDKARSRQLGGTGLGLSIAQSIVHAHRGQITAESQVGQGTAFHVRLSL